MSLFIGRVLARARLPSSFARACAAPQHLRTQLTVAASGAPSAGSAAPTAPAGASATEHGYVRSSGARSARSHAMVDEMLRVDHAGEVGAVQIYAGQMWVLKGTRMQDTLHHMKAGEEEHLRTVVRLMSERRVRPTILLPLWEAAGFALGAATALLGRQAAMACTVAVETAVSEHYNDQVRQLLSAGSEDKELITTFAKHRDEELEHHDTAKALGAEKAPLFAALSTVIQAGCVAAIQVAKRV